MEIACLTDRRCYAGKSLEALDETEAVIRAVEAIGASVESERPGEAFFSVDGLRGLFGSSAGVLAATRQAVGPDFAIGSGRSRFTAFLSAIGFERPVPVSALKTRLNVPSHEAEALIEAFEKLGIATICALTRLTPDDIADRFGPLGLRALKVSNGDEEPLRPREPHEEVIEEIVLPEGTAGLQLDRALELLVDQLLAAPQRNGRTLVGLRLGAFLSSGGNWAVDQGLGRPTASPRVLCRVLGPRLDELPGPADLLRLQVQGFGPPAREQLDFQLGGVGAEPRRRRLRAAVREVRNAQGPEALLRILPTDPMSRVPERRLLLAPYPEL